jgi:hypothetical protein
MEILDSGGTQQANYLMLQITQLVDPGNWSTQGIMNPTMMPGMFMGMGFGGGLCRHDGLGLRRASWASAAWASAAWVSWALAA